LKSNLFIKLTKKKGGELKQKMKRKNKKERKKKEKGNIRG
jgi:hypothetical protein